MLRSFYPLIHYFFYCLAVIIILSSCKKNFAPPAITAKNSYLVVDGVINTGENSITTIFLTRTRNLGDTATSDAPELNAVVTVSSTNGNSFVLKDSSNSGMYSSSPKTLDVTQKYSVSITTSASEKYITDFVETKQTPPVDSLYWEQPDDFTIYVDTHDPNNNTHYYRWQYVETWEHDAKFSTPWGVNNGIIFAVDSLTQKSICYSTQNSTDVLIASSANLGADVIKRFPVITILNPDSRLDNKYSLLIKQFALTKDAFTYWQLIKNTSQTLGSFFDLQPSQLSGNIHSLTNPTEPVIGYMSASSVEEKRIFLFQTNLTNWHHNPPEYACDTLEIPVNQVDYRIYNDEYPGYAPYYFITNGPLVIASSICLDCTLFGGTTIKPSYWK
jgi:hypothetical protein